MKIALFFLFLLLWINNQINAQWTFFQQNRFYVGAQIGISCSFGTHQNRIGLIAKGFAGYDFVQINPQVAFYRNLYAMGANTKSWEVHTRLGFTAAWGLRDSIRQVFINEVSNQTLKRHAVGYAFIWYWDTQGTKQKAAALAVHSRNFSFIMENDFLSFIAQDRYRTGSISLSYTLPTQTRLILKHISYTGDPYGKNNDWVRDTDFPARFGYMNTEKVHLGNKSIGSLTIGAEQMLPFYQQTHLDIGIDAEQVRNTMQNKLIHDNLLLPANWGDDYEGKNPHIPMLDIENKPYLYTKIQKIRKPKFFVLGGFNGSLFY